MWYLASWQSCSWGCSLSLLQLMLFAGTHGCQTRLNCSSGFPSQSEGGAGSVFTHIWQRGLCSSCLREEDKMRIWSHSAFALHIEPVFYPLVFQKREGLVLRTLMMNLPPALLQAGFWQAGALMQVKCRISKIWCKDLQRNFKYRYQFHFPWLSCPHPGGVLDKSILLNPQKSCISEEINSHLHIFLFISERRVGPFLSKKLLYYLSQFLEV